MIYITFNSKPFPCISVELNTLPPDILFKISLVALPIGVFFDLAETAIPIFGLAIIRAEIKNLFQALCVPLKNFCSLLLIGPPSSVF